MPFAHPLRVSEHAEIRLARGNSAGYFARAVFSRLHDDQDFYRKRAALSPY